MKTAQRATYVTFVLGVPRGTLALLRYPLPRFLRFVVKGNDWTTLDALDQLDDEPSEGEHIIVGERDPACSGSVHMDFRDKQGRRRASWSQTETYRAVADQPPQETLRSVESWREWCQQQASRGKGDGS